MLFQECRARQFWFGIWARLEQAKPSSISLVPRALSYMAFTSLQVTRVEAAKALKGRVMVVSTVEGVIVLFILVECCAPFQWNDFVYYLCSFFQSYTCDEFRNAWSELQVLSSEHSWHTKVWWLSGGDHARMAFLPYFAQKPSLAIATRACRIWIQEAQLESLKKCLEILEHLE